MEGRAARDVRAMPVRPAGDSGCGWGRALPGVRTGEPLAGYARACLSALPASASVRSGLVPARIAPMRWQARHSDMPERTRLVVLLSALRAAHDPIHNRNPPQVVQASHARLARPGPPSRPALRTPLNLSQLQPRH